MANAPKAVDLVLGGWMLSGVLTLRTGVPLTITESPDTRTPIGGSPAKPHCRWESAY